MTKPACQGASRLQIKRMSGKVEVTIFTSRPGLVIGKKGAEIDILKNELRQLTGKEVWIEVEEIKRPDLDAKLVADAIAKQLERRIPFRRVLKKTMQTTMDAGAAGIKVQISGRIGGAEIARVEWYKEGRIPLHTLRADIDYATGRAETTYGSIGVKVWINHGEEVAASAPKHSSGG
jgi:small subunit ribosomal protein S3